MLCMFLVDSSSTIKGIIVLYLLRRKKLIIAVDRRQEWIFSAAASSRAMSSHAGSLSKNLQKVFRFILSNKQLHFVAVTNLSWALVAIKICFIFLDCLNVCDKIMSLYFFFIFFLFILLIGCICCY